MSVKVTGILRDSGGNPAPNKVIKFYTTKGFDGALPSATLEVTTSGTGQYNFELSIGIHILSVQYNDSLTKVNKVTVTSDMSSPQTLDSLLAFDEPLLPDEIIIVQGLVAEANAAAVRAETAASSVEGVEAEVEADRQEVANNTAQVAADAGVVAAARQEVSDNAAQVAADTITVTNAQADVTTKAAQVSTDAAQVATDALSAEEDALLAEMWAVGGNPDSTTPSDTNNSKYWSDRAAQFATGALLYGGLFTPTTGTPYPPPLDNDIMYLVNFTDPEETFTYTDGDLSGTTVKNGNAIIYNTPENKYEASSFVFTGVATVNGKSPDGANNVTINAGDVGAYSTTETYTKDEVISLLESVNDHRIGSIEKFPPIYTPSTDEYVRMQGSIVNRASYQKLFDKMNLSNNMVTDAEWLAIRSASPNGAVAVYSSGDGSTTFRLPTTGNGVFGRDKGSITDPLLLNVGQQDQIVNITGLFRYTLLPGGFGYGSQTLSGAFFDTLPGDSEARTPFSSPSSFGQSNNSYSTGFDASRQVNTGPEVQPNNMYESWYIYTGKTSLV